MFFVEMAQAMGATGGDAAQGPAGAFASIVPLVLMIAIFYFLLIRPQQKRAKEHKLMQAALKVGDKVITAGGIYGEIIEIDKDDVVTLDIGGTKIKIARPYISPVPAKKAEKK